MPSYIYSGDSEDFVENTAGGFIATINIGNSTDCSDLSIPNDAADGLIATDIDAGNSKDFAEDALDGLIDAINAVNAMNCADITVSDDAADGLITFIPMLVRRWIVLRMLQVDISLILILAHQ